MSDHMFQEWLMSTRVLQRQSFGVDPAELEGKALAEYVRWNHLAAIDELMEALHEVDWKPWTVTEDGFRNRDAFVDELVDVLHFVANELVAARCTDEELSERYAAKQQKNRDRMASGTYDGVKEKCRVCGRAFDDSAVRCYESTDKLTYYCVKNGIGAGGSIGSSGTSYTLNPGSTTFTSGPWYSGRTWNWTSGENDDVPPPRHTEDDEEDEAPE